MLSNIVLTTIYYMKMNISVLQQIKYFKILLLLVGTKKLINLDILHLEVSIRILKVMLPVVTNDILFVLSQAILIVIQFMLMKHQ